MGTDVLLDEAGDLVPELPLQLPRVSHAPLLIRRKYFSLFTPPWKLMPRDRGVFLVWCDGRVLLPQARKSLIMTCATRVILRLSHFAAQIVNLVTRIKASVPEVPRLTCATRVILRLSHFAAQIVNLATRIKASVPEVPRLTCAKARLCHNAISLHKKQTDTYQSLSPGSPST